jgi:hypothetical protein
MHDDDFDDFDWESWGVPASRDTSQLDARNGASSTDLNGHAPRSRAEREDDAEEAPVTGWVTMGGVAHWEEPDGADDPRVELNSPLAADDLSLPDGAPDAPRVRAVHAWMARQRAREQDALGALLLAAREQQRADDEQPQARKASTRRREALPSPLELAIAEHQAATDEYAAQLEQLDEHAAHSGPGRALVEYYLWLTEYLATLAVAPEADNAAGPATTRAGAAWRGRALAALAVRGRVERVAAPSADDD